MKTGECFKEGLLKRVEPSNEKAERSIRRFRHTTLYGLDEVANRDEAENAIRVARRSISEVASIGGTI